MSEPAGDSILVDETGLGAFQVAVRGGSSTFLVDEPVKVGGLGSGPSPYELLSAAIGSCTLMTLRMYARRKAWPLERVRLKVTHRRASLGAVDAFVREIELVGPLDAAQRERLLEIATRCPVSRTIGRGSVIDTLLTETLPEASLASSGAHARDTLQLCDQ